MTRKDLNKNWMKILRRCYSENRPMNEKEEMFFRTIFKYNTWSCNDAMTTPLSVKNKGTNVEIVVGGVKYQPGCGTTTSKEYISKFAIKDLYKEISKYMD